MNPWLPIGYGAVRTGAAILIAKRARSRGASIREIVAQGVSDVSLGLGIIAFAQPNVAQEMGGVLSLLVAYAIGWEIYAALRRAAAQFQDVPGEDLSAASIGRSIVGIWEFLGVIPAILMAAIGAQSRVGAGEFLFENDAFDALTVALLGLGILVWVHRHPPSSRQVAVLLRALSMVLLLVAVWVWL